MTFSSSEFGGNEVPVPARSRSSRSVIEISFPVPARFPTDMEILFPVPARLPPGIKFGSRFPTDSRPDENTVPYSRPVPAMFENLVPVSHPVPDLYKISFPMPDHPAGRERGPVSRNLFPVPDYFFFAFILRAEEFDTSTYYNIGVY